jgi:hypothetical protein
LKHQFLAAPVQPDRLGNHYPIALVGHHGHAENMLSGFKTSENIENKTGGFLLGGKSG